MRARLEIRLSPKARAAGGIAIAWGVSPMRQRVAIRVPSEPAERATLE